MAGDRTTRLDRGRSEMIALAPVACLTALAVEGISLTATMVYGLNFSVTGPNPTALLIGLLATGWTVAVGRTTPRRLWAGALAVLLSGLVAGFGAGLVAALGGITVATAATPLLVALLSALRERAAVGVATGLVLVVGLRVALRTAPPWATLRGRLAIAAVGLACVGLAALLARRDALPGLDDRFGVSPSPLGALLIGAAAVLASPAFLARWGLVPYTTTVPLSVGGLVSGAAVVALRGRPTRVETAVFGAAYVGGTAALLWLAGVVGVVGVGLAEVGAIGLLAAGSGRRSEQSRRRAAVATTATQVAALLAVFLFVAATSWQVFPAIVGDAVRGLGRPFLFATLLTFPVAVVASRRGKTPPGPEPATAGRRAALATLATGVLAVGGLARRDGARPSDPGDALTVTTYNVHQFLDAAGGEWNLEAVRSVLAAADADVIGLQESEGTRITGGGVDGVRWLAETLGYEACYGPATRGSTYGVALLSRWPIRDERVVFLPVSRSPPRPALLATVERPGGDVPVIARHFQTQQRDWGEVRHERAVAAQVAAAERLLSLRGDDSRTVVLGDFNAEPGDAVYERLASEWTDALGAVAAEENTYSAADPTERIDHVFVGDAWTPVDAAVSGGPAASDHRAVTVSLAPADR